MRGARAAVVVGLALTVLAVVLVLSRSPLTVVGGSALRGREAYAITGGGVSACQEGGTLPRGTSAIRLALSSNLGPLVRLKVLSGGRVVARGERGAGWGAGETVTVPVGRVPEAIRDARVCTTLGPSFELMRVLGPRAPAPSPHGQLAGRVLLRMEYLAPGQRSWLSLAPSIARHMGLGRAAPGTWVVFLLLVLVLAAGTLSVRLAFRELR